MSNRRAGTDVDSFAPMSSFIRDRIAEDSRYCATGDESRLTLSERTRILQGKLRLSIEQAMAEGSWIRTIWALLGANVIAGSRAVLKRAESDAVEGSIPEKTLEKTEKGIVEARILGAEARWDQVIAVCRGLLASETPGVWRLTVEQMAANACFELGHLREALRWIDESRGLQEIYPHSPVNDYLKVLEIKCLRLIHQSGAALDLEARWLNSIQRWTPDRLLTACRMFSACGGGAGDFAFRHSARWAAYEIAKSMGDDLYAGLALAEIQLASPELLEASRREELAALRSLYPRIDRYLSAGEKGGLVYHSASLAVAEGREACSSGISPVEIEWVYLDRPGVVLSLRELEIRKLDGDSEAADRIFSVLRETREAKTKEDFFREVWSLPFHKLRHKTTLSMALRRFSARTGIRARVSQGAVRVPNGIVLRRRRSG